MRKVGNLTTAKVGVSPKAILNYHWPTYTVKPVLSSHTWEAQKVAA